MTVTSLVKRSRVSAIDDSDIPLKRVRRQTRSFVVINDENQDPKNVSFEAALSADVSLACQTSPRKPKKTDAESSSKSPEKSPARSAVPLTPSTPRFRDGLASRISSVAISSPATPTTPVTPRHRVMSVGRLSRRMTPRGVPGTPMTPAAAQTVYHKARQLFSRSSGTGALIGRDEERTRLCDFLEEHCAAETDKKTSNGSCLYVSGPPGTGKSAMVTEMTDKVCAETAGVRKAYVNCMSIRSSGDLYNTLLRLLSSEDGTADESGTADTTEADAINTLQAMFLPKKGKKAASTAVGADTFLVVLDEIDHIVTLDLESLYRVIEWSMLKTSRLVLVGIANALDLTDRFLPRLKSRNLQPELLPFLPYTAAQIKNIIVTRLRSTLPSDSAATADFLPFFHPAAVELCSRKVASQTGDLRKAFEILRRALGLAEAEAKEKCLNEAREAAGLTMTPTKKRPLGENVNLASSLSPFKRAASGMATPSTSTWLTWAKGLTVETAPRVSIGHLNKVTSAAFGNGAQQRLRGLNLQQKAALCALSALEKWNRETHAQKLQATPSAKLSKLIHAPKAGPKAATKSVRGGASAAPTIKMLFDTYCKMCKCDAVLHPLSSSEFREVVGSLETLSLVTAVDGRTGSFAVLQTTPRGRRSTKGAAMTGVAGDEKQVASCVGEKELQQALEGPGADILLNILSGEALD
ncbi:cell division control protein [Grosmannia clavigera kw1407]|uniref:Cell division control protein n=1 Tax=Grosmannia clavigera (strain kw1407 / UAMH 11150) TaxID=655863 RepID=F0XKN1_GROCL|nr:cell division control protein [Grosmannia clavigera kw1407]EFX01665.1 cell division control protein [Grosmannia clavigera kw1407]